MCIWWNLCSSQHKRQQLKKASHEQSSTNGDLQPNNDVDTDSETAPAVSVPILNQESISTDAVHTSIAVEYKNAKDLSGLVLSDETKSLVFFFPNSNELEICIQDRLECFFRDKNYFIVLVGLIFYVWRLMTK